MGGLGAVVPRGTWADIVMCHALVFTVISGPTRLTVQETAATQLVIVGHPRTRLDGLVVGAVVTLGAGSGDDRVERTDETGWTHVTLGREGRAHVVDDKTRDAGLGLSRTWRVTAGVRWTW